MENRAKNNPIISRQNFYQLFAIQTVSLGIPVTIIGKQLAERFGAGTAICSVFIGNLILWVIGIAITSIASKKQTNAIENIKGYIGKPGSFIFALILIFAFIDWYVVQIDTTTTALNTVIQTTKHWDSNLGIRVGASLGILAALLAIGGMRTLKWLTVLSFPPLIIYNAYIILISDYNFMPNWNWGISFSAVISSVLVLLPGIINLPTFFRHSQSQADSFFALTLMVIFYTFFECATIWMGFSENAEFIPNITKTHYTTNFVLITSIFLILTSTCSNLLNIYLASACYETFIPKFSGTKGHAIMGLIGTSTYTFIQISYPVTFSQNILSCYIAVLGIVLLIGVITRMIIKHRFRKFEQAINLTSWLTGCIVSTILIIKNPDQVNYSLLSGMWASTLFFLLVFFIEETYWSYQKIWTERKIREKT